MKKIINFLFILLMISFCFATSEDLIEVNNWNEGYSSDAIEEREIFSFVSSLDCAISSKFRADYDSAIKSDGTIVTNYGARCDVSDRVELLACLYPGDVNQQYCQKIFQDDWLIESEGDTLPLRSACGGDCYNEQWFLDAIDNKYIGYNCKVCGDELENDCVSNGGTCKTYEINSYTKNNNYYCKVGECYLPDQPKTTCEKILDLDLSYNKCYKLSEGLCSADDKYYCAGGYIYVGQSDNYNDYYCIVNGEIESASFTNCPNGCINGECETQICIPNFMWCQDNSVKQCSSDGNKILDIDDCNLNEICIEKSSERAQCELEQKKYHLQCDGNIAKCVEHSKGEYLDLTECETDKEKVNNIGKCESNPIQFCGDDICNNFETTENCPLDCFEQDDINILGISIGLGLFFIVVIFLIIIIGIVVYFKYFR